MCKKNRKKVRKSYVFFNFVNNVRTKHISSLKKEICKRCHVSHTAYYKWRDGITIPRAKNKEIINSVANDFGYGTVFSE